MQQITPNVYVETGLSTPPLSRGCNASFVVTSEGIVMIDSPMYPTYAIRWREEIARRGEVCYIINTEYHPDHISGNYFFSGTVISHHGVREMFSAPIIQRVMPFEAAKETVAVSVGLREHILHQYEELDPEGLSRAENYQPRPPTITFSERLTLYLGDHTFELIHLPGHTPFEVGVYVPQERVIFTGDNFANKWQPSLADCCPLEWLESLKRIEAMDADYFVPGHGGVGDKIAVREFASFVQGIVDTVKKAVNQGIGKEEAADRMSFEGWLPALHASAEERRMDVIRLHEMLSK